MRWDVLKFWALAAAVLVALLVAGAAIRGRRSAQPSDATTRLSPPAGGSAPILQRPAKPLPLSPQSSALVVLGTTRSTCATVANRVSVHWSSLIEGSGATPSTEQIVDPQLADTARKAMDSAEVTMRGKNLREGEAGAALMGLYLIDDQLCSLARNPTGYSLKTYNEAIARLGSAADGAQARLKLLAPGAPRVD